jgi:hypothetical protein
MSRSRITNYKSPKTSITYVQRPKTVILGDFGLSGSHKYPHILHKNLKITPKNYFWYSHIPLLTVYDERNRLQAILNNEGHLSKNIKY